MSKDITKLMNAIYDTGYFLDEARALLRGDLDAKDLGTARSELANASNAIDDAMGEIDKLTAWPPTRSEWTGD